MIRCLAISVTNQASRVDAEPARERRAVFADVEEAAPDDHVRRSARDRHEQRGQLGRIVLPVSVDLDGDVEAVVARVPVSGLHGAADAEVEGQPHDERTVRARPRPGSVGRPVVDDEDLEAGIDGAHLLDHAGDRRLLVQSRDDRHATHGHEPLVTGCRQGLGDGPHKITRF